MVVSQIIKAELDFSAFFMYLCNMEKECIYDICWHGRCGKKTLKDSDFCKEHSKVKCSHTSCDKQAVGDCHSHAGSFICGAPTCKEHKHTH
jgi:hypothetical protein